MFDVGMMTMLGLVFAAVAAVVLVRALRPSTAALDRRVQQLMQSSGLALSDAVAATVTRRIRRDLAADAIGRSLGLGATFVIMLLADPSAPATAHEIDFTQSGTIGLPLVLVGGALGSAVVALSSRADAAGAVRIARSSVVGLPDYVGRAERWAARAVPAVSSVYAAALLLTARASNAAFLLAAWLFVALSLVAWVVFEVGGRWILRRPQVAASVTELAWDDALRAMSVRSLADASIVIGGFLIYLLALPRLIQNPTVAITIVAGILVGAWLLGRRVQPQRYFLTRLWPDTAAAGAAADAATRVAR